MVADPAVTDGCLQRFKSSVFPSPSLKRGRDGVLIPLDPTDHVSTAKTGPSRTGPVMAASQGVRVHSL